MSEPTQEGRPYVRTGVIALSIIFAASCRGGESGPPASKVSPPRKPLPQQKMKSGPAPAPGKKPATAARLAASSSQPAPRSLDLGFDLRANLPLAHLVRGGVIADAASVGFVKYIRDVKHAWKLNATEEGRPAAYAPGRQVLMWIPVSAAAARAGLALEAVIKPIRQRRVEVFVNDKKVGEQELTDAKGWRQLRIPLPAKLVKVGVARIRLYFGRARSHAGIKTCVAVRYLGVVPAKTAAAPLAERDLARYLEKESGGALVLPDRGGLDYYITPPAGLRLRGEVTGAAVEVLAQLDGKAPERLALGKTLDVSLDALAGRAVRLMLRGRGERAALKGARLDSFKAPAAVAVKRPKYVVFWLIDALRADKLDFYGKRGKERPLVKTPHLSKLAGEGAVFDPFWVNSDESKASHASYWTGTYPAVHRVFTRRAKLKDRHVTLAEVFLEAGFNTAAFVSNGFISRRWNYLQGFQRSFNFIREGVPSGANAVVDKAIPWIDRHRTRPFYLYLGTSDPHVTYRVHKEFIGDYDKAPYAGLYRRFLSGKALGRIKEQNRRPGKRDRQRIEAIYENELAFNDHHFGRLVAHMKKLGLHDQTLYIIGSDHGEEFWEHGSCGHGHSLHRELVSVPLVLRFPGVIPRIKVTSGHDGVDLIATVTALLGRPTPAAVQGESLLPFLDGRSVYPRAMVASRGVASYALQAGPAKVIYRSAASIRTYDIGRDPTEKTNIYRSHLITTLAALDPLSLFVTRPRAWRKAAWGAPNNLRAGAGAAIAEGK